MHITFQSQGGIAFIPALNGPLTIDTAQLPAAERDELERKVHDAGFFALAPTIGTRRRGAADMREYTVRVEHEGRDHTVHIIEPYDNSGLEDLLEALQSRARK